ncbi:MAG: YciI family protein [Hydrogenophilaceae bacterium]|jgi:hypothetical protein|nr:YciI family protein [Hydrogenophilaceae bacterium]
MKYAILIYGAEADWASQTPEEMGKAMEAYFAYSDALAKAGKAITGQELAPVATAKTVRILGGAPVVADGPFAETKEQLGGFYLIEAENEADALEWAARCPGAQHGTIELRPCIEH